MIDANWVTRIVGNNARVSFLDLGGAEKHRFASFSEEKRAGNR